MQVSSIVLSKVIFTLKIILPLAVLALAVMHIFMVVQDVPLADEWRWLKDLLIPYQQGDINFWQYVTGEYAFLSHSHYLALLFILADYQWLGLDFAYMAYVGLVAYLLTWGMLVWYFLSLHQFKLNGHRYCGLLIFTIGYFSSLSDFPWLLVLFEYIYLFFAIGLLCLYDIHKRDRLKFIYFIPGFIFCTIFADTIGLIAVLVILAWTSLLSILKQESWQKTAALWLAFASVLALQYVFLGKGIGGSNPLLVSLFALLNDPAALLKSFAVTFAQPLVDKTILSESSAFKNDFRYWHFLFGFVGFTISLTSLWLYLSDGGLRRSHLPCLLMLFGIVAWATILVSRYLDVGLYVFDARRFTRLFTFYYIGAGFALSFACRAAARKVTIIIVIVMATLFGYSSFTQYKRADHVQNYFSKAKAEMRKEEINQPELMRFVIGCKPKFCEQTIKFLRERQLSIFRGD